MANIGTVITKYNSQAGTGRDAVSIEGVIGNLLLDGGRDPPASSAQCPRRPALQSSFPYLPGKFARSSPGRVRSPASYGPESSAHNECQPRAGPQRSERDVVRESGWRRIEGRFV